jgi:hypothetical protein
VAFIRPLLDADRDGVAVLVLGVDDRAHLVGVDRPLDQRRMRDELAIMGIAAARLLRPT